MSLLYPVVGIDVSYYQRQIDWDKAAAKIHFAMIKASQSTLAMDSQFQRNWQEAKARGIPRGAYHFFVPRATPVTDPRLQAENFARVLGSDLGELPCWLDCESDPDSIDISAMWERIGKFLNRFKELTGRDCGIYTRASWWDYQVTNGNKSPTDFPRIAGVGPRPLWVAHYGSTLTFPSIPWDWSRRFGQTCWQFWQWAEDKTAGPDYGVQSMGIDLNRYNGEPEDFEDEFDVELPDPDEPDQPDPEPEPDPEGETTLMTVLVDTLNIRMGPGTSFQDIGDLRKGDVVRVLDVAGPDAWVMIEPGKWACAAQGKKKYLEAI